MLIFFKNPFWTGLDFAYKVPETFAFAHFLDAFISVFRVLDGLVDLPDADSVGPGADSIARRHW